MQMKRKRFLILMYILFLPLAADAGDLHQLAFRITPGLSIPLGSSSERVGLGGETLVGVGFVPAPLPFLSFNAETGYKLLPIKPLDSVNVLTFGAGAGVQFFQESRFHLEADLAAGMFYGFINDEEKAGAWNFFFRGSAGGSFSLTSWLDIILRSDYTYTHLFSSILSVSLGTRFSIPLGGRGNQYRLDSGRPVPLEGSLEISQLDFFDIYPVLFKYYDDHPVGRAILTNPTEYPADNIEVSLFVEKYMSDPKSCCKNKTLAPGESMEIDLLALFDDSVLEITEGTKVSSKLILKYSLETEQRTEEHVQTMELYDRNALTWDDDRKAAAFVTAKDPQILEFSKNVSSWIKDSRQFNKSAALAMAIHESLGEIGISYAVDPSSAFSDFSQNTAAVDFIQFPRQTVSYSGGDCDDLSILYCALLEALGVTTAFITIPGHIYIAVGLDLPAHEAEQMFPDPDELIVYNNEIWLPLEITKVGSSFMEAWQAGAKQWREHQEAGQAAFLPTSESWKLYRPVGLPGKAENFKFPDQKSFLDRYVSENSRLIAYLITNRVDDLQRQIRSSNNNIKYRNRLGVLYARYGLIEEAGEIFKSIAEQDNYVPALINMGIVEYLSPDAEKALTYFSRAAEIEPDNPKALLNLAKAQHKLEQYADAKNNYAKFAALDPELAERFAYLGGAESSGARASATETAEGINIWDEE
jgi:hypothetical protein